MWGKLARYLDEEDLKVLAVIGMVVALGVLLTVVYFRKSTPVRSLVPPGPRAKLIEGFAAERSGRAAASASSAPTDTRDRR